MSSSSVIDADPEQARLAVLHSYRIVDTPPESQFDDLVRQAAEQCGAPAAALVLVDEKRCWFKARVGLEKTEVARDLSFCGHAFRHSGLLEVHDARLDSRFNQIPIVAKEGFNFFAGIPLITPDGHSLGSLCVMDREPRRLSDRQVAALKMLSRRAMDLFEQRRTNPPGEAVKTPPATTAKIETPGSPGLLLIVDDDDAVRSFVCVASRRLGYKILEAPNGIEALKQLEKNPGAISLVLTDINMPAMDGLELVKALNKLPARPGVAVMSGRFDPYIRTTLQAEGITALLSKPFSGESLKQTLLKALANRK